MEDIKLNRLPVEFDEVEHTYTFDGTRLRGITGIISEYVLPERGEFIEKMKSTIHQRAILEAATKRGHDTHTQVQMIVEGYGYNNPFPEVKDFFKKMADTKFIASEYLVSDLHHFASSIDIIDSELNLYDIKTTSKLDTKYLSWQLSIYAYLFELCNPKLKVKELYGCWLRDGKARVVRVDRIPDAIIQDLLAAAADGLPWSNPFEKVELFAPKDLAEVLKFERQMAQVETRYKQMQAQEAEMKERIKELMAAYDIDKWTSPNGKVTFTLTPPHTQSRFDTTKFKADHSDLYEEYLKDVNIKASLTIKVKDENA